MINMLISLLVWINRKKPYRRTRTFVLPLCGITGTYLAW